MTFIDARLNDLIERGALGGPEFKTRVLELESGFEQRNEDWEEARLEWDIGYGLLRMEQNIFDVSVHEIRDFFYAVARGRLNTFRFKDFTDFEIGKFADATSRQQIALGDDSTTVFQTFKRYTSNAVTYDRNIQKLVTGTIKAYKDASELTLVGSGPIAGEFAANLVTGQITTGDTFASTGGTGPGSEEVLAVILEFDVHVRFNIDKLNISVQLFNSGAIPELPVREVREELAA